MSKNIEQIFLANAINSNISTDLMYFGRSPYGSTDDAAMTFANFQSQFQAPIAPAALTEVSDTNVTLTLGGTPSASLFRAVSITAGWSGLLSGARGGTGVNNAGLSIDLSGGTTGNVLTSDSLGNASWQAGGGGGGPWSDGVGAGSGIGGDGTATASGNFSLAFGDSNCSVAGQNTFAMGTTAVADINSAYCLSFGSQVSTTSAAFSVVFGQTVSSVGSFCFAFGNTVTIAASSNYSFAFGNTCTISAGNTPYYSFCFGLNCTVNNSSSVAWGSDNITNGTFSWALGNNAVTNNDGSVVWGDFNASPVGDSSANQWNTTFAGGYYFYINNTPTLAVTIDTNGNLVNNQGTVDLSYSLQAPSNAFSITIANNSKTLILNPSGTLTTGQVILPSFANNGQEIRICTSQTITTLTVTPGSGDTLANPYVAALTGGTAIAYIYIQQSATWFNLP